MNHTEYSVDYGKRTSAASPKSSGASVKLYVAKNGSASGDGTLEKPFATLEQARDKAKSLIGSKPSGGIAIYIRGGIYPISKTFSLNKEHSGLDGAPIFYEAYPGETPVFSGGISLAKASFKALSDAVVINRLADSSAKDHIVVFDLAAAGISDLGELARRGFNFNNDSSKTLPPQLFINGKKMTLSRWPNAGRVVYDTVVEKGTYISTANTPGTGATVEFKTPIERFSLWKDQSDIWIDGILSADWSWTYNKVRSLSSDGKQVSLQYGDCGGTVNNWVVTRGFHFENLLEELDMPGEYYIDRTTKKLYFYKNSEFEKADASVMLSMNNDSLVTINGASNIVLRGLTFELTRKHAIYDINAWANSTVSNFVIDQAEIRNIGENGISLGGKNNVISNCYIHDIGKSAVIVKGGDLDTLASSGIIVENNYIDNISLNHKVYSPAFSMNGVGITVRGNTVKNVPHIAILMSGNDNVISYNDFYNIMTEFRDVGMIHLNMGANPQMRGSVIANNFFHDYEPVVKETGKTGTRAVYLDNGTQGVIVVNNIFANAAAGGVFFHGGGYNICENNLFSNVALPFEYANMYTAAWTYGTYKLSGNNASSWKTVRDRMLEFDFADQRYKFKSNYAIFSKYPGLEAFLGVEDSFVSVVKACTDVSTLSKSYLESIWLSQPQGTFRNNLLFNDRISLQYSGTKQEFNIGKKSLINIEQNSILSKNPGFANESAGDFSLDLQGFKNIRFSEMGIVTKNLKVSRDPSKPLPFETLYPRNNSAGLDILNNPVRVIQDTKATTAGIFFVWQQQAGCDKYTLELSEDPSFPSGQTKQIQTCKTQASFGVLKGKTTYYWRVFATDIKGNQKVQNTNGTQKFTTA